MAFLNYIKDRIKNNKLFVIISLVYVLLCMTSMIYCFATFQIRNALMSLLFMFFVLFIILFEYFFKIKLVNLFVTLVYLLSLGGILGTIYEFYTIIPFFDTLLHGMSGLIFACLGYSLLDGLLINEVGKRRFFSCMLFGVAFSLAIAVIWEIFEYAATIFLGFDMMEDSIVDGFNSYLLAGSHNEIVEVNGIVKTIIYYGDNQVITINGYLDLGLIDTLHDMIICLVGAILFVVITIFSYFKCPIINNILLPKVKKG